MSDPGASQLAWVVRHRYFPAVEGMRGLAAVLVLIGHAILLSYTGAAARWGDWLASFGVVAFFTISGFLLYRPFLAARHAAHPVSALVPSYFVRRAVRILPAYWIALTILAIWPGLVGVFTGDWWIYYGLLQNYSVHATTLLNGLSVAWTLCIEVSFYLALPLLAAALASRGLGSENRHALRWELSILGGLGILSLVLRGVVSAGEDTGFLVNTLVGTFGWFVVGMLLACVQVVHPEALRRLRRLLRDPLLMWPLAVGLFCALPLFLSGTVVSHGLTRCIQGVVVGLAAGALAAPIMLADEAPAVRLAMTTRAAIFLGTISYGIYLWHLPIMSKLSELHVARSGPLPVAVLVALSLAAVLALASASWYGVEKPLMRQVRSIKATRGP